MAESGQDLNSTQSMQKDVKLSEPSVFIPAQITKSQEEYIAKRKQLIENQQAAEKQLKDKHKPPGGKHNNSTV